MISLPLNPKFKANRSRFTCGITDHKQGLLVIDQLIAGQRYLDALDLFEQLYRQFPKQAYKTLAIAYDLIYQRVAEKNSRYCLYQCRFLDFQIQPNDKVLDIGSGHMPFPYATHLADLTIEDNKYGRGGKAFESAIGKPVFECSVEQMPFADKEFDFVYCSHVLEHTENPEKACRELMRVAKRGYIETPTKGKDLFFSSAKSSHHRWGIDIFDSQLVFSEYTEDEIIGFDNRVLWKMLSKPATDYEKALHALQYLRADVLNNMFYWENGFDYEVRRLSKHPIITERSVVAAPVAKTSNDLAEAVDLFQKAQDHFMSGQMLSARKLMAEYQSRMDYTLLPRTDRRNEAFQPEMSVIVVTRGRTGELGELLGDLTAQTYRPFETILVDNGDTDVARIQNKADSIVHCPINFKAAESRNIGAHFARGKIFVFIDDDARIEPGYLSAIKRAFQAYRILGLRGKTLPKTPTSCVSSIGNLGDAPLVAMCNQEGNAAFLAGAWRAVGGQDPLLFGHEGIDLSWRLKQAFNLDNAMIYCPDAVIYHDYGDAAEQREKKIRYTQISNYLRYKFDCDITVSIRECENSPPTAGDSLTWVNPHPGNPDRWRSLCYTPTDAAIRAIPGVKVSIIISCYNAEPYLAECLDSIRAQTLTEWETIIVDDGSKDRSPEILKRYAAMDCRFKIHLNTDNQGPYRRRNFAIGQAQAPFIVLHDADDMMAPQKLEILLGEILKDDRLGIVGSFYGWFRGQFTGLDGCDRIACKITYEEILRAFLGKQRDICCHAAAIMRKSLFDQIGLYDTHPWGADSFWLTKAALYAALTNAVRFRNIPEYLSFIRKHSESQTGKINPNDPRGRRKHLVKFFRAKLQQIVEKKRRDPAVDVGAELQACTCSDFIPLYGHLFEQWESAPVDMPMIKGRIDAAVSEMVNRMTVRAAMLLDTLESMLPQAGQKLAGFNLLRGLCQFSCSDDQAAEESLRMEYQTHRTVQAQRFIDLYLKPNTNYDSAGRRKIADEFLFNYPEIERPTMEVIYDNRPAESKTVSIIMDCRFSQVNLGKLIAAWSGQRSSDFELVLVTHKNSKSDYSAMPHLPVHLAVVNTNDVITRATAKKLVMPHCRGEIVAFVSPHLMISETMIEQLITCFKQNTISGVRGKILTRDIALPHPEYHLGDTAHYSTLSTDVFCAVRRGVLETLGPLDGRLFGTELLALSHQIYNQTPECTEPIVYLPALEGIMPATPLSTDYLLNAIGCQQLYWRLSAPEQFEAFMNFAVNYYCRSDMSEASPVCTEQIAQYFTVRCRPAAMEWVRKANLPLPNQADRGKQEAMVSVIMPAYNAAQFIGAAIDSVLGQSYPHLELIIVNDGSTDSTEQLIRQFKDFRIRLETQPNAGPAAARNRGLKLAAGQFVVFLDADDMMTPEFIADHLGEFESHPETDLVYCNDYLIDEDGKPMRVIARKEYTATSEIIRELFRNGYPIVPFRTCIRRRVFNKIGLYDPALRVAEDYDMIRRFFAAGLVARHLNRAHYLRRLAPNSQSRNLSPEKAQMHLEVVSQFIRTFDPSWLFPQVSWQSMDAAQRQHKITAVAAEFFLSLSLNYMKMPGHEAYAEHALQVSERYLSQAPANPECERVMQTFQQTRHLFERWSRVQNGRLSENLKISVAMSNKNAVLDGKKRDAAHRPSERQPQSVVEGFALRAINDIQ